MVLLRMALWNPLHNSPGKHTCLSIRAYFWWQTKSSNTSTMVPDSKNSCHSGEMKLGNVHTIYSIFVLRHSCFIRAVLQQANRDIGHHDHLTVMLDWGQLGWFRVYSIVVHLSWLGVHLFGSNVAVFQFEQWFLLAKLEIMVRTLKGWLRIPKKVINYIGGLLASLL